MVGTILQTAALPGSQTGLLTGLLSGIGVLFALVIAALYVYFSLAYQKIGEKAGMSSPGIAWMPYFGNLAVMYESSKRHWWPFAVLAGGPLLALILVAISPSTGMAGIAGVISALAGLVFAVMAILWHWHTYVNVGRPGWWAVAPIILAILGVLVGLASDTVGTVLAALGGISHLVFVGMASWGESKGNSKKTSEKKASKKASKKTSKKTSKKKSNK